MRPLKDLLVLDFSTLLPGPLATLLLAEAGADVIKIERPGSGDAMRKYEPLWGMDSAVFALLNRGKKSIALDLKERSDRERLRPLLERADVIVEQFRPGVMTRLGLDYPSIKKINCRTIYCSITAYGQTGPNRDRAAHDLNLLAESGLLAVSMSEQSEAVMPPTAIADIAAGAYPAALNIMLALQTRASTGRGRFIDVSLSDNLFTLAYWAFAHGWTNDQWPSSRTALVTGSTPRYRLYVTRDHRTIAAAPLEQRFWENFCDVIRLPNELRDDRRNPEATARAIVQIIASEDAETWARRLGERECCCSMVGDLKSASQDPHFKARGLFDHKLVNDNGATMAALPVPIDAVFRAHPAAALAAPVLDSHHDIDALVREFDARSTGVQIA